MAIKLDTKKACDRLERDFIKKFFNDLGIYYKLTDWIMQCITTTTFTMIVTGKTCNTFQLERGIC